MANLNFQQPPRSVANQGLSRGAFGSSSLSGHVTPTSSLFPAGTGLNSAFTQSLSPIRNLSGMTANRSFTGSQRPFQDKRPGIQGLGGSSVGGSLALSQVRQYSSQMGVNGFQSVFGVGADTSTPPLLDLSEFPSLTNRGPSGSDAMPQPSPMPGKQPYVGMVKQPTSDSAEFQMSSEDFPALPGTQAVSSSEKGLLGMEGDLGHEAVATRAPGAEKTARRGIQTSPDGKVTHIPNSMVKDQFGMIGLLQFIRAAESDTNLMSLALGQDLTALGLNLNQPDNLYQSFGGPFSDHQCRPQDLDYPVPPEYFINHQIKDKLAPIKLSKYKDELLFYLFYTYVGDYMQMCAANELYEREWRYHLDEKVWLIRVPGLDSAYYVFDPLLWRKVLKELHVHEERLEGRPRLPPPPQLL